MQKIGRYSLTIGSEEAMHPWQCLYQTRPQMDSLYVALVRTLTRYVYQLHSSRFVKALGR